MHMKYINSKAFDSFSFFSAWLKNNILAELLVMIGMIVWKCCFALGCPALSRELNGGFVLMFLLQWWALAT